MVLASRLTVVERIDVSFKNVKIGKDPAEESNADACVQLSSLPITHLPRVNCKVGLQNVVQHLFLRGNAGHDFVHLCDNSAEEGSRAEEEKDAVDLRQGRSWQAKNQQAHDALPDSAVRFAAIAPDRDQTHPLALRGGKNISCANRKKDIIDESNRAHRISRTIAHGRERCEYIIKADQLRIMTNSDRSHPPSKSLDWHGYEDLHIDL